MMMMMIIIIITLSDYVTTKWVGLPQVNALI